MVKYELSASIGYPEHITGINKARSIARKKLMQKNKGATGFIQQVGGDIVGWMLYGYSGEVYYAKPGKTNFLNYDYIINEDGSLKSNKIEYKSKFKSKSKPVSQNTTPLKKTSIRKRISITHTGHFKGSPFVTDWVLPDSYDPKSADAKKLILKNARKYAFEHDMVDIFESGNFRSLFSVINADGNAVYFKTSHRTVNGRRYYVDYFKHVNADGTLSTASELEKESARMVLNHWY